MVIEITWYNYVWFPWNFAIPWRELSKLQLIAKVNGTKKGERGGKTRQTWTHFWNVSPWNDCWRRSRTSSALLGPSFSWRMYASPPWVCPPSWTLCPSTSATRQHSLLQLDPPTSQTGKIYIKLNLKKIIRLGCFYAVTNWHTESDLVHVPLLTGTPGQI